MEICPKVLGTSHKFVAGWRWGLWREVVVDMELFIAFCWLAWVVLFLLGDQLLKQVSSLAEVAADGVQLTFVVVSSVVALVGHYCGV